MEIDIAVGDSTSDHDSLRARVVLQSCVNLHALWSGYASQTLRESYKSEPLRRARKNTTQRYLSFRVREEENLGKWTDNSTSYARLQLQIGFNTILQKEVLKEIPQKNDENFFARYNLTIIDGQRADYLKMWSC